MQIEQNRSLKTLNTFGVDVNAEKFVSVNTVDGLKTILKENKDEAIFILGGGSNMLLIDTVKALVIHLDLKGITKVSETEDHVLIKAMAGENWHEFVTYCIENNFGGLENLSLIPGNVGTSPIQNIGAYGVELKDNFVGCETVEIATLQEKTFSKDNCEFGYRNSIFKNQEKGKYVITAVTFKLTKRNHQKHIDYGAIKNQLTKSKIENPSIQDISEAVIAIRQSKLPDPKVLGNSGSFFKNPIIGRKAFQDFSKNFPEAPSYKISETEYKIPAGWLIEQAGFKGKRFGNAGIHKNQALVLVNHGNATGKEIWELAMKIQKEVSEKFGILIEPEVNVI